MITTLPQHDGSEADVEIAVPLTSLSRSPVRGEVHISFDDVNVTKQVTVSGGGDSGSIYVLPTTRS